MDGGRMEGGRIDLGEGGTSSASSIGSGRIEGRFSPRSASIGRSASRGSPELAKGEGSSSGNRLRLRRGAKLGARREPDAGAIQLGARGDSLGLAASSTKGCTDLDEGTATLACDGVRAGLFEAQRDVDDRLLRHLDIGDSYRTHQLEVIA